ncbi:MAG: hypothetical protein F4Y08_06225 [Caldilineaceae bacterium SB0662_bin_9]|uniref:Uncharacterized protein n=1 Tax=Caldilineaceae bacterium SB0662_bin_9 TaxID=2605258 RepID=A0A6B1DTB1_9CHLR|nr:hypothetical protein [Caldilineaceae bacterium SB0662_bin_9]
MSNSDKLIYDIEEREDGTIVLNVAREKHQKFELNCFTVGGNDGFQYLVEGENPGLLLISKEGIVVEINDDDGNMVI